MNFFSFHIGDYSSATGHLSWDEDLAYRRLIEVYYVREAPIPLDARAVYRLVRASAPEQREAVDTILAEFFERTEEGYVHHRCDEEIASAREKREKASQSASKRWRNASASEKHANALKPDANAMPTQCEGNAPNPNPNPNPISASRPDPFDEAERLLRAIEGLDKHPVAVSPAIAPIWQLYQQGLDLKRVILPSIRRQVAAAKRPIKNWAYFVDGIVQDAEPAAKITALSAAVPDDEWRKRLSAGRRAKAWQIERYGPIPGTPGCRVPQHLLEPGDGDGWADWKASA